MSISTQGPRVYSVTQLTREIQTLLEGQFEFLWVEGEISNFRAPASGHYYMVFKDGQSQIRAVMFRPQARYLKFLPENGMKIIAQGRLTVYGPRGEYQIILDYLEPLGVGALALAFEQLKEKLAQQGLFDQEVKRPLPFLPQRVAVITSPTGAAIRDFLNVIHRRFANLEIIVVPVRVQGEEAASDMVRALEVVNQTLDVDVIVLTRGGGSLEDLWAFNQEALALAIRRSEIPVVSAVGHEIDVTISDLAADFRASTPSAAAELLVAEKETLITRLMETRNRMLSRMKMTLQTQHHRLGGLTRALYDPRKRLADAWLRLDDMQARLVRMANLVIREQRSGLRDTGKALLRYSPRHRVPALAQRVDFLRISMNRAMSARLSDWKTDLSLTEKRIMDLNPSAILSRGYSITLKLPEESVLTDAAGTTPGGKVRVRLAKGELGCRIEEVKPGTS